MAVRAHTHAQLFCKLQFVSHLSSDSLSGRVALEGKGSNLNVCSHDFRLSDSPSRTNTPT